MRKRNIQNKSSSSFNLKIDESVQPIAQIPVKPQRSNICFSSAQANVLSIIPTKQRTELPNDIPFDDVGSDHSEEEEIAVEKPAEENKLDKLLCQLNDKLNDSDCNDAVKVENEINKVKGEYEKILSQINEMEKALGPESTKLIWKQKQFFTELIDFVDNSTKINFDEVRDEYLMLETGLERLKKLRILDQELYKKVGLGEAAVELFEFYANYEISKFSFKSKLAMINMEWIQAGWFWMDEDGNEDMVPKVFEKICLPFLSNLLQTENFETQDEFRIAYYHCLEACDFCVNQTVAEAQLMSQLKRKLQQMKARGNQDEYDKLMDEFGLKNNFGWRVN